MGALGGDGRVVIGIDDNPLDTEEMLGVRCDCHGFDGFHGPVFAGHGGRFPIHGNHASHLPL